MKKTENGQLSLKLWTNKTTNDLKCSWRGSIKEMTQVNIQSSGVTSLCPIIIAVMLSEKDLIKVLKEMTAKWYMFGCAMGISMANLDIIEDKGGMERYMTEMLGEWLNTGSATWEKLQEALRSVGNKRLASELGKHILKDQQERLTIKMFCSAVKTCSDN